MKRQGIVSPGDCHHAFSATANFSISILAVGMDRRWKKRAQPHAPAGQESGQ
jgi:hypothetical protein